MTKAVRFTNAEVIEATDLEAVSKYAREGDENIVGGAIGYPSHWAEFTVETPSASAVRVNPGRYFKEEIAYDLDAAVDIDLTTHLPTVIGDTRYVAILARGVSETIDENRFIETDVATGATTLTPVPKTDRRTCSFVVQQGLPSPTPVKPVIDATDCALCFVLLGTAGVVSVGSSNDHRVKTLYEVEGRVTQLEGQMVVAFGRTQTLQTDLANLQSQLKDYTRTIITRQLQADMARTRRLLGLPDAARAYFYDPGLVDWAWSKSHVTFDARVDEGLRFPYEAIEDVQLAVQNPAQAGIRIEDGVLMLDWTETMRIEVDGSGGTKNISQQVHTVTTSVARTVSRSSTSYGPTVAVCGNTSEYSGFDDAATGQAFQKGGETFQKVAVIGSQYSTDNLNVADFNASHGGSYNVAKIQLHNAQVNQSGNRQIFAARSVVHNSWTETHWDEVTETFGINGSIYGQSFLLTQPIILTSIDVPFDRVGSDGDVTMFVCNVSPTGEPLFDSVITKATVAHADLSSGWVKFGFKPRYLDPGKRYAWVTVTTGNHSIRTVTGSQFTQGTLFWSTDGAWFQGSNEEDFCFRVNSTAHSSIRAQILFDPLSLSGGMTEIKLLYESWDPDGTSMIWEIRKSGADPWEHIQPETDVYANPLRGLPENCQLRLTMIGDEGLSPAIILNENARGETHRHKPAGRAISKVLEFGLSTVSIDAEWTLDMYDDLLHTATPKVMVGVTEYVANSVTIEPDVQKPERRIVKADFTVPSTTEARTILEMTTSDYQSVPFVENTSLYAN